MTHPHNLFLIVYLATTGVVAGLFAIAIGCHEVAPILADLLHHALDVVGGAL